MTDKQRLHILLIEDQLSIAKSVAEFMENSGHVIDFATSGSQGLSLALASFYDVVVLDLNLPAMDGLEVCAKLREQADRHIPILMLTARDSIEDKVTGFTAGADDYLTKPFSLQELAVRCHALARRHLLQTKAAISIGPLIVDRQKMAASRENKPLALSSMGLKILTILAEAYPKVVTRSELSQKLWGDDPTESDAMRSHIYQLRAILDKPFDYPMLRTVFGVGFSLEINQDNKQQ